MARELQTHRLVLVGLIGNEWKTQLLIFNLRAYFQLGKLLVTSILRCARKLSHVLDSSFGFFRIEIRKCTNVHKIPLKHQPFLVVSIDNKTDPSTNQTFWSCLHPCCVYWEVNNGSPPISKSNVFHTFLSLCFTPLFIPIMSNRKYWISWDRIVYLIHYLCHCLLKIHFSSLLYLSFIFLLNKGTISQSWDMKQTWYKCKHEPFHNYHTFLKTTIKNKQTQM